MRDHFDRLTRSAVRLERRAEELRRRTFGRPGGAEAEERAEELRRHAARLWVRVGLIA